MYSNIEEVVIYEAHHHLSGSLLRYRNNGSYVGCDLENRTGKIGNAFEFSHVVGIPLERPRKTKISEF